MKILKISFCNVNSLKGVHEVDFEDVRLANAGIFAITGATGAGKSTLLDVITLALFNRVPRFDSNNPNKTAGSKMTKAAVEGLGTIVTHHCKSAYAEVSYEIDGNRYRSHWSIEQNRNGNWKDYDMELAALPSGEILSDKKGQVPALNEEKIGLQYTQFVKSIILSQGQFSKFLRAEKNERTTLLESITGGQVFRELGKAAGLKAKEKQQALDSERRVLESIDCLPTEKVEDLKKQNLAFDSELKKLLKQLGVKNAKLQTKESIATLKEEIAVFEKQQVGIAAQLKEFRKEEEKIKRHESVAALKGDLALYEKHWNNIVRWRKDQKKVELQLQQARTKLKQTIEGLEELVKQQVTEESFMPRMKIFENKVRELQFELQKLKENGQRERASINALLEKVNFDIAGSFSRKVKPSKALELSEQRVIAVKQRLSDFDLDEQQHPDRLRKQLDALILRIRDLDTLKHKIMHRVEVQGQISQMAKQLGSAGEMKEVLSNEQRELVEHLRVLEGKVRDQEKLSREAIKVAELSDHRAALIDGEACPLCGATEHPFVDQSLVEIGKAQLQLEKLKRESGKLQKRHQELIAALAKQEQIIQLSAPRQKQLQLDLDKYVRQIEELLIGCKLSSEDKLEEELERETTRKTQLQNSISLLQELMFLNELSHRFEGLRKELDLHAETSKELKSLYAGDDLDGDVDKLQNEFSAAQNSVSRDQNQLEVLVQELAKEEQGLKSLEKKLSPFTTEMGFSQILEARTCLLTDEHLAKLREQKLALNEKDTTVRTRITDAGKNLAKLLLEDDKEIKHADLLLELRELEPRRDELNQILGANRNALEQDARSRDKLDKLSGKIKRMEEDMRKWTLLDHYIGDSTGNKFANFAQSLTLRNLLHFANLQLSELTDRYRLARPADPGDLQVIDEYQGGSLRSVSTLSGGETFIVSLALALSLSDLASRNVRLDSLFIDEGFGTLDHETLDDALNTLEKLQSKGGKTIGVISHVESLKERITTQIRLEKGSHGHSRIEIVF